MSQKANSVESSLRQAEIKKLLLQCKETSEIVHVCSRKWDVTPRQVFKYIAKAMADIRKELGRRDAISLTWHIKARRNIIDQSMDKGDTQTALRALADIGKLQGLYVEKVEHSGTLDGMNLVFKAKEKPKEPDDQ